MPAIIPLIATGITAYQAYSQHKQNKKVNAQQDAIAAQQGPLTTAQAGLANQQREQGQQLFSYGMPLLQRSGDYYSKILGGNRAATDIAIAPDVNAIGDSYRGAFRSLTRMTPGANRDVAQADLIRQRAGQIGGLVPAARAGAANATANLGQVGVSGGQQGLSASSSSTSNLLSSLLGQSNNLFERQQYGNQQSADQGKALSQLLTMFAQAWQGRQAKGGGGGYGVFTGG